MVFAVCIYQLGLPNVLMGYHGYDDGAYLGSALGLINGAIPYRDFVMVQPPGITLLMTPIAALESWVKTDGCLALARDVTVLVTAANAVLVARAVRHHGVAVSLLAGTALACFPLAPAADQTLMLEPYLTFFCLIGQLLMFRSGKLAGSPRVFLAGLAFGFAGTVKLWAVLVIGAAVVVCAIRSRPRLVPLVAGSAVGFGLPTLPFFLMAPAAFLREIVSDQAGRLAGTAVTTAGERTLWLTGLGGLTVVHATETLAFVAGALYVVAVVVTFVTHARSVGDAERFLLLASALVVGAMFLPNDFYQHYAYFPAAFLAMLGAVTIGKLLDRRTRHLPVARLSSRDLALCACIISVGFLVPQQASYARSNLSVANNPPSKNLKYVGLVIPLGACVVSTIPSMAIVADVFSSDRPGCPVVVDSFGVWLADGPKVQPPYNGPYSAAFVGEWAHWLSRAGWVIEDAAWSPVIPWTGPLRAWFKADFKLAFSAPRLFVYQHVRWVPSKAVDRKTSGL